MSRLRRLALSVGSIIAVLAILASVLYVGLSLRWPIEKPFAYWMIDDQTLGVIVLDSPSLLCGIPEVDESSDAVRIHAQCLERVIPVPQTGMAQRYVFQLALRDQLGHRTVFDGLGHLAELCTGPVENCHFT
jgi:hypothetical protein